MPLYDFRCPTCVDEDTEESLVFEVQLSMTADKREAACPECGGITNLRVYTPVGLTQGLTAAEKAAGTTKHRADLGKYAKDARQKRKKAYGSNTYEGQTNELWTGTASDNDVWKGPSDGKKVNAANPRGTKI